MWGSCTARHDRLNQWLTRGEGAVVKQLMVVAADLVAMSILAFGIYFPRHHRRDLVTAFLGVNICVVAVSLVLSASTVGTGLGLSLFGVLSIIRLRSDEVAQHEVAYYFASLTIGLLAGVVGTLNPLTGGLMLLVLVGPPSTGDTWIDGRTFMDDDGRLSRAEPHDTTDHRRIRAEARLPESVPEHDDGGRLGGLVAIHEHTPHQGRHAGHPKSSGTDLGGIDGLPHLPADDQVPLDQPERADVLEGAKSFPPFVDVV